MNRTVKWVTGIVVGVVSFMANPHGPLGVFWRPDPMTPDPTNLQLPFFLILNVIESASFAYAVVLLLFSFPKKALSPLTLKQTRIAFMCLVWFLGNWWAHDSFHLHNGMNLQGLLYIEYGFHVTMILSSLYLIWTANRLMKARK